jgi:transketolase
MSIEPIVNKWAAFGWHVIDINGHDMEAIVDAFNEAETVKMKPTMIVARTIKGKGISFFEGKVQYHGITPTYEELEMALKELEKNG